MSILDKIIFLLETKNLTQKALTDYLGLKKGTFTSWKSGLSESYKKYLPQIADFLDVSVDYLLGKSDEQKNEPPLSLTKEEATLLELYRALNEPGQQKLLDYSHDLVSNDKYKASTLTIAAKGRGAHVIEMTPEELKALKKALADLPDN